MSGPETGHRDHEVWHIPEVAQYCHFAWQGGYEQDHRRSLGDLCRRHFPDGASVLDVGCGTGLMYGVLVPAVISGDQYTGIDIAEPMLSLAREHYPDGCFLYGDAYRIGYGDGTFDAVICFAVLGHLPGIRQVLGEIIRVSRHVTMFSVWNAEHGVTEGQEHAAGYSAPHRSYSREYLDGEITAAAGKGVVSVTAEGVDDLVMAYVITKGPRLPGGRDAGVVVPDRTFFTCLPA